jgi:hypothetical protein
MLHRMIRTCRLPSLDPKRFAVLQRNLAIASCAIGIMISAGVWVVLLEQPAHATNCNGSCGTDTGTCTGAATNCPNGYKGFCSQSACSGLTKRYNNIVAQGTSNSPGVRTVNSTACFTTFTCGFVTSTNQTCLSGLFSSNTCSPSVGPSCTFCGNTGLTVFSYYACTLLGPCNEG